LLDKLEATDLCFYFKFAASNRAFVLLSSRPSTFKMKPVVSAFNAWSCVVVSCFAIVILSVLADLFARNHHSVMGQTDAPADGKAVAASLFIAVAIYAGFLVFCGIQAYLNVLASRRGQISLR